jgi:hypothetical protein
MSEDMHLTPEADVKTASGWLPALTAAAGLAVVVVARWLGRY